MSDVQIPEYTKSPNGKVDYQVDWESWLNGDTISTSTWTVQSGITKVTDTKTDTTATIWLSGGSLGQRYIVTNHIVTAAGREEDQSLVVYIMEK